MINPLNIFKKRGSPPLPAKKSLPNIDLSCLATNMRPKLAIHSGEGRPGKYHLDMWIPAFEASGVAFCIITRTRLLFDYCKEKYSHLSFAYFKEARDGERLLATLPELRTIFYLSNTGNNIHTVRFNHIKHVFLGHGDSEKSASAHKFFRVYDEVWVAGQAHIDRFANAPFDSAHLHFAKIGRPNLRQALLACDNRPWAARFPSPRLLYLPTWEGLYAEQDYSSLSRAQGILSAAFREKACELYAKLHPLTGSKNTAFENFGDTLQKALGKEKANLHVFLQQAALHQLIHQANIFCCDVSGAVTECLAGNAPVFVYKPRNSRAKEASSSMPFDEFAYTFASEEDFAKKLRMVLSGEDPLAEGRMRAMHYFMGRAETLEDVFSQKLREEAGVPLPAAGAARDTRETCRPAM